MDYTTLAFVRADLLITETSQDTTISRKIAQASRFIDRYITGRQDVQDYFKQEAISGEILLGNRNPLVDCDGHLHIYPHKPSVSSVVSVEYRFNPMQPWQSIDLDMVETNGVSIEVWGSFERERIAVRVSYAGGLGADVSGLPADIVEMATVLAGRMYKEVETGLSDSIGIAELGMIQYTKALPVRVQDTLERLKRKLPW